MSENIDTTAVSEDSSVDVTESSASVPSTSPSKEPVEIKSSNHPPSLGDDVVDKLSSHVKESAREATREAIQEQAEKDAQAKKADEKWKALTSGFQDNFENFAKSNPELAGKVREQAYGADGMLNKMTNSDIAIIFKLSNAPEILAEFVQNPDEFKQYQKFTPDAKSQYLYMKSGELIGRKSSKAKSTADGKNYQYSAAPEPIDKIKEGSSSGLSTISDYEKMDYGSYKKHRDNQILKEAGYKH